jgi:hypothetical protein
MPDESERATEPAWLIQPPSRGEVRLYIAIDEAAEVSPAVRAALEQLAQAIQNEDVEGFAAPPRATKQPACPTRVSCNPEGRCTPLVIQPCFMLATGCMSNY